MASDSPDDEEESEAEAAFLRVRAAPIPGTRPMSPFELLHAWRRAVEDVEALYDGSLYEYLDLLGCREMLARLGEPGFEAYPEDALEAIQELDERFEAATSEVDHPLAHWQVGDREAPRWWKRIPKVFGARFARDLQSHGIFT